MKMCMMQAGALTPAQAIVLIALCVVIAALVWQLRNATEGDNAQP